MFHFDKNFGLFIGKLTDNKFHKHYALQISVSVNSQMTLSVKNETALKGGAFFINSNIEHQLVSEFDQLTILINPLSSIGHQLYLVNKNTNFTILNTELSNILIEILNQFVSDKLSFKTLCEMIFKTLFNFQCKCESGNHFEDDRVINAIKHMNDNFENILSLKEVSALIFLSPSRFLHLFKEKTNLSFRRYQL